MLGKANKFALHSLNEIVEFHSTISAVGKAQVNLVVFSQWHNISKLIFCALLIENIQTSLSLRSLNEKAELHSTFSRDNIIRINSSSVYRLTKKLYFCLENDNVYS